MVVILTVIKKRKELINYIVRPQRSELCIDKCNCDEQVGQPHLLSLKKIGKQENLIYIPYCRSNVCDNGNLKAMVLD